MYVTYTYYCPFGVNIFCTFQEFSDLVKSEVLFNWSSGSTFMAKTNFLIVQKSAQKWPSLAHFTYFPYNSMGMSKNDSDRAAKLRLLPKRSLNFMKKSKILHPRYNSFMTKIPKNIGQCLPQMDYTFHTQTHLYNTFTPTNYETPSLVHVCYLLAHVF